jgi:hypothetical protein
LKGSGSVDEGAEPDADQGDVDGALVDDLSFVAFDPEAYKERNTVERCVNKLCRLACWSFLIGMTALMPRLRR